MFSMLEAISLPLLVNSKSFKRPSFLKLMTHTVVGYPNLETSAEIIKTLDKYSEYIELQIPYSDPIADWPVIMQACQASLDNWTRVKDAFDIASSLKDQISAKMLFMTYWNIIYKYWVDAFLRDAKKAWIKWFIVPDISPDNLPEFFDKCKKLWLLSICIFAPTSSEERMKYLSWFSSDLAYTVARTWITWSKTEFWEELTTFLDKIKSFYKWELALGFWIKSKKDIDFLRWKADIAVIWSQLIREFNEGWITRVDEFLASITS